MADSTETAETPAVPQFTFKKRSAKSKANFRKKAATPPPASDSSGDDDDFTSDEEEGRRIKRRRKNAGAVTATSANNIAPKLPQTDDVANTGPALPALPTGNDATKASNWYDEGKDGQDMSAKALLGTTRSHSKPDNSDGTYKGTAGYSSFIQTNPDAPSRKVGPIKNTSTNVRTITVTDFAPDVCKDYKQTGFCGFGDSCKFLHAREDYKQGWQLDRDWEIGTKGKKVAGTTVSSRAGTGTGDNDDAEDAELEKIPFACIICKGNYKSPIVTKCGHYFCESCALQRYRKDPKCAACGAGTGGVFNVAKRLKVLLERKREREKKKKAEAEEEQDD